jgi:hypothetical protein
MYDILVQLSLIKEGFLLLIFGASSLVIMGIAMIVSDKMKGNVNPFVVVFIFIGLIIFPFLSAASVIVLSVMQKG